MGEPLHFIRRLSGQACYDLGDCHLTARSGSKYGERSCSDDELLSLMEANDNHEEEHTVGRVKLLTSFLGDGTQTDQTHL